MKWEPGNTFIDYVLNFIAFVVMVVVTATSAFATVKTWMTLALTIKDPISLYQIILLIGGVSLIFITIVCLIYTWALLAD